MEKFKNIALIGAVVGVLVLIGLSTSQPNAPTAKDVAKEISLKLGALVGPDIPFPYLSVSNNLHRYYSADFSTSSSTLCQIGKTYATSTVKFTANITTSTSTALYLMLEDVSKATTTDDGRGYAPLLSAATSTLRGESYLVPANTTGEFVFYATTTPYTTSLQPADRNGVIKPSLATDKNYYLVFHAKNAGGGTISQSGTGQVLGGSCKAELQEL